MHSVALNWCYLGIVFLGTTYCLLSPLYNHATRRFSCPGLAEYMAMAFVAYLTIVFFAPLLLLLVFVFLALVAVGFFQSPLFNYASSSVYNTLFIYGVLNLACGIALHQYFLARRVRQWKPKLPRVFARQAFATAVGVALVTHALLFVHIGQARVAQWQTESDVGWLRKTVWVVTHMDDMVYAGALAAMSHLLRSDDRGFAHFEIMRQGSVPPGVAVKKAPLNGNYVFVSDLHLLEPRAKHDHARNWGKGDGTPSNFDIYLAALDYYAERDFHLVEAGDIEDLVVRAPSYEDAAIDQLYDFLFGPFGNYFDARYEHAERQRRLFEIGTNYASMYEAIRRKFWLHGRFTKLIGNHDELLLNQNFVSSLQAIYRAPIEPYEYLVLEDEGRVAAVAAHGHQFDPYCAPGGGQELICDTFTTSGAWLGTGADRVWPKNGETPPGWLQKMLSTDGFQNAISFAPSFVREPNVPMKWRHMDEQRLVDTMTQNGASMPFVVLGHTHEPRINATDRHGNQVPKYLNSGSSGLYEQLIWLIELVDGQPTMTAWYLNDGSILVRQPMVATNNGRLVRHGEPDSFPIRRARW